MKKIICLLLMQALMLINALPLINQTTVHARPRAQANAPVSGPTTPAGPFAARDPELELMTALLLGDMRPGAAFQKPAYKLLTPLKLNLVQEEDDLAELCLRVREEILKKLDDLGLELEKLAQAMSRSAGVADNVLTSPVLRRTFRSTMREAAARLAARGLTGRLLRIFTGPLGWVLDLLTLIAIADIALENYIREDLMANNPNLTEDEAREMAEDLSDLMAHMQVDLQRIAGPVGGDALVGLLHLMETFSEQRSCRIHNRNPRNPPGQPRYFPPAGHSPDEIRNGFPCAPGYNNSGQPSLPPSEPGSNGTSGSVDGGTITVTAPDPCKNGGR